MAIILYIISLIPLYIYIGIKYYDEKIFPLIRNRDFEKLTFAQSAFMVSIVLFFISCILVGFLKFRSKSKFELHGVRVTSNPTNINHELIGILSSVVLPFLTVNFTTPKECYASIFMLLIIGIITINSSIYYKNPVLVLLKFKIYQIEVEHTKLKENKIINIISFKTIKKDDSLYLKEIGEEVFYATK